jgi:clan AA aspartic protease (TIGR02281 family)
MKQRFLVVLGICLMLGANLKASAESDTDAGMKCFQNKDYKGALAHFQKTLAISPTDYNSLYYSAVIYHQTGVLDKAKVHYAKLIQLYPQSDAGKNAAAALGYIDPAYLRRLQPQAGTVSSGSSRSPSSQQRGADAYSDNSRLPNECQVYFEPRGNNMVIDAYVNNRPTKMIFDTGAETVVFGKNHLRELGIAPPQGEPTGLAMGVGAGGAQRTWSTRATIKVGQIERHNFPITIQDEMPTLPLLGQTFFKDFYYSIQKASGDTGSGSIRFKRKVTATASSTSTGKDSQAVPFTRQGNEIVVSVDVNGRTMPMYFDTGAEHCVFSEEQLKQVGVQVPDDAQEGMSMGIAGATRTRSFSVNRMKLGPIEKTEVPVSVVDDYKMRYPLLGQTFFGDLRYEMDNDAHVLRIRR